MSKTILYERALSMKINPTKAEKRFAELLEINNIKFKQQYVIGNYIVDFLIKNTVIELDGSSHIGREVYDEKRDSDIRALGFKVFRILNSEVERFNFNKLREITYNPKQKKEKPKEKIIDIINKCDYKKFKSKKSKRKPKGKPVLFNQPLSIIK